MKQTRKDFLSAFQKSTLWLDKMEAAFGPLEQWAILKLDDRRTVRLMRFAYIYNVRLLKTTNDEIEVDFQTNMAFDTIAGLFEMWEELE